MELPGQVQHRAFRQGLVDRQVVDRRADEAGQRNGVGDLGVQLVDHRPEEGLLVTDPGEVAAVVVVPDALDFELVMNGGDIRRVERAVVENGQIIILEDSEYTDRHIKEIHFIPKC